MCLMSCWRFALWSFLGEIRRGTAIVWVVWQLYPSAVRSALAPDGYSLLPKLLVSPLVTPIVVPYIIPYITPFKEFKLWLM